MDRILRGERNGIKAVILTPTRELAQQIDEQIFAIGYHTGITSATVIGGSDFSAQAKALNAGVDIVVATPGRFIDQNKIVNIDFSTVEYLVLDEADRMLDMGFIDDIRFILSKAGKSDRQTLLFSATMPTEILKLAKEHMKGDVREVMLNREEASLATIDQSYLLIEENQKLNQLIAIIKPHVEQQVIVFAATKIRADKIAHNLKGSGFRAAAIHGDLSQRERDMVMGRFRKGADMILVATDVASRGIDVPAVSHVINYDVPGEQDTYFHRIGRTARAGAKGNAVTLVTPDRFTDFERIMRRIKLPVKMLNESMGLAIPAIRPGSHGFHRRGASSRGWKKQAPFARSGPRRQGFWGKKSGQHGKGGQGFRKRSA